ncbi:MAG: ABC transporter permease [Acidobacteriota bacterium]
MFATIFSRNLQSTWSAPIWIIVAMLQPFFWVFVFAQLFEPVPVAYEGVTFDYLSYFGPGMLAATTFFGAMWAGIGFGMDRKSGVLNRFRMACRSHRTIMAAYVMQSLTGVLAQALVVLVLVWFLGADLNWSALQLMLALGAILLLGFAISSLSHLLVVLIKDEMGIIHINGFIGLPLLFVSGVLFPITDSPGWLKALAQLNPLHHSAEILRAILTEGYVARHVGLYTGILVLLCVVFFEIATRSFRKQSRG